MPSAAGNHALESFAFSSFLNEWVCFCVFRAPFRVGSFIFKGYLASFGNFRCDIDILVTTVAPPRERHCHSVADSQSPRSNSGSRNYCFAFKFFFAEWVCFHVFEYMLIPLT